MKLLGVKLIENILHFQRPLPAKVCSDPSIPSVPLRRRSVPFFFVIFIQLRFRKIFVCCLTRFDFDSVSQNVDLPNRKRKHPPKFQTLRSALCRLRAANLGQVAEATAKREPSPAQPGLEFRPGNAFTGQRACNRCRCCHKPLWGISVSQCIFGQGQIYWLIGILGISFKLRFAPCGLVLLLRTRPRHSVRPQLQCMLHTRFAQGSAPMMILLRGTYSRFCLP